MNVWGIDVGGANLKMSAPSGDCAALPFPMWTEFHRLGDAVEQLISDLRPIARMNAWDSASRLAVTMTGELADCFESRRAGVESILAQLKTVIPDSRCLVYCVDGQWRTPEQARVSPWSVAASNWHALANWCLNHQRLFPNHLHAIVDIGSTTVDVIPTRNGSILTEARTDRQRLERGQLVYTGMERTPIHAIVRTLKVNGAVCPVMAERFATMADANLVLGAVAEEPLNCDTADNRPRTRHFAMARLARMVGEDNETLSEATIVDLASQVCIRQAKQVARALKRNLPLDSNVNNLGQLHDPLTVLVTGHGRPLIERMRSFRVLQRVQFVYLDDYLGPSATRCAPALAVSRLCCLHLGDQAQSGSQTVVGS